MRNKKGFTLIELLAVIVILAIILLIAVPQVTQIINKAKRDSFISSYKMVLKQMDYYALQGDLAGMVAVALNESEDWDLKDADYDLTIIESVDPGAVTGQYTVTLKPADNGNFENIDIDSDIACADISGLVDDPACTSSKLSGIIADYIPSSN